MEVGPWAKKQVHRDQVKVGTQGIREAEMVPRSERNI